MNEMVNASIVPFGYEYETILADNLAKLIRLKKDAGLKLDTAALADQKEHLSEIVSKIYYVRRNTKEMKKLMEKAKNCTLKNAPSFILRSSNP